MSHDKQGESKTARNSGLANVLCSGSMDRPLQDEDGTYWRQESKDSWTLLVQNKVVAGISLAANVVLLKTASQRERVAVPGSACAFDVAEVLGGVGRVEELIGLDGRSALHLRHQAEDAATRFRRVHSPAREPRHHLHEAWQLLNDVAAEKKLSPFGKIAHAYVKTALREFEAKDRWTQDAIENAKSAAAWLAQADDLADETFAGFECLKAVASLEQGRAAQVRQDEGRGTEETRDLSWMKAVSAAARQEKEQDRDFDRGSSDPG